MNLVKRNEYIRILILIVIGLLLIDIFYTGFIKFGYTYIKCGGAPVKVRTPGFWSYSTTYLMPGKYFPGGADGKYFCTEAEAQAAGFQRDGF